MKALVIYDSVFGNTEKIARAIGEGLGVGEGGVVRVEQASVEKLVGLDLLVVGSPTRGFSATPAVKQFLNGIPAGSLGGMRVAAFDTRISTAPGKVPGFLRLLVRIFGYAAEPIHKVLLRAGGKSAAVPAGFLVEASEGPLSPGELERAAAWGKALKITV